MKKVLYLGTKPLSTYHPNELIHYPVIRLVPKKAQDEKVLFCLTRLSQFSHCIITSKHTVSILCDLCSELDLDPRELLRGKCVSIGPITTRTLLERGIEPLWQASLFTQEGLIRSFEERSLQDPYLFYPRSSLARPLLMQYLFSKEFSCELLDLYDTELQELRSRPSLDEVKEIVFTSPSTVEGFFKIFQTIPKGVKISFQGPITERAFLKAALCTTEQ